MSDLRKVGALWKKDGKNGTFYSGKVDAEALKSALAGDETRLLLFKVKDKRPKGPDLELFCVPDTPRDARSDTRSSSRVDDIDEDSIGF